MSNKVDGEYCQKKLLLQKRLNMKENFDYFFVTRGKIATF